MSLWLEVKGFDCSLLQKVVEMGGRVDVTMSVEMVSVEVDEGVEYGCEVLKIAYGAVWCGVDA